MGRPTPSSEPVRMLLVEDDHGGARLAVGALIENFRFTVAKLPRTNGA